MEQQEEIQKEELTSANKKALLVEDNRIVQRVISAQLTNLGYEVTTANDAVSAILRIHEYHYHLIVTDLRLPDKYGDEVIKAARQSKINQGTPLIVGSAQISKSDFQTYLDIGADVVLIKPVSKEILKNTIQTIGLIRYERQFLNKIISVDS